MRIAVSTENGLVFKHFGTSPEFTIFDYGDSGEAEVRTVERTCRPGHNPAIDLLAPFSIDVLIGGEVCLAGISRLEKMGVTVYSGHGGEDAAEIAGKVFRGELESDADKKARSDISMVAVPRKGNRGGPRQ
ncbi:MAG: hypothetical protein LKJ94_00080 [Candidatus Methanomethylophilus sp.]|jgi:predicted Fe-Mo cluster-binding NifX family protein|nr:hypothetical protein [Methanomethylophilus sp.]MCI2074100.1 hypothetical protein [Methanomethylophilus sp.]MCI2093103.1 hypothetical protein [Methanomethylophilus sp.]MEE3400933.1 NifB/NifX family molybdenum-iron cluster-binding protein [Methanomethylophilus sp.]